MPRKPRLVLPNQPHHVYNRGNNRRRLFSRSSDYLAFIRNLANGLRLSECRLWQLTLMPNHFHMVVVPPEPKSLATLMKESTQRYAQWRNEKREGSGTLFEGRFKSKVVDSDAYLLTLMLYNDANAYRVGLVTEPGAHAWSTVGLHSGQRLDARVPAEMWTPSPWYLSLGGEPSRRFAEYRRLLRQYLELGAEAPDADLRAWSERVEAPYARRVERPDRSSAREDGTEYGPSR